jgi:hypothetical protein
MKREWSSGLRNNHYFCNLLGLMFIAKCFKEDIEMNNIGNFAKKEFLQEINFQFNKDGSNFEGSLSYHFFVLEMLYFGLELLDDESIKFIKDYETIKMKIQSIIEFSSQIFGSNHFYPQIGDNDSGKIFDFRVLSNFHQINIYHNYLNICLKRLINDVYKDNMINHLLIKEHKHLIYKDIGLFIYKNEKFNLWISFGRNSQNGKGGHNHLDAFSFVLQVNGKEIITDPGTFAYTSFPDKRNIFRSAISHNCLYYPEMDTFQTENPEDLFWLQDKTCNSFIEEIGETIFLKLERLADNYNLKRTFEISKDKIILTDEIPESLIEKGEIGFHLHPSIHDKISVVENKIEIQDYMNICFDAKNKIEIMDYEYSPGYGKIETSKKIVVSNLINTCHFEINIIN